MGVSIDSLLNRLLADSILFSGSSANPEHGVPVPSAE